LALFISYNIQGFSALKALQVHKACKVNKAYLACSNSQYYDYGSTYKDAQSYCMYISMHTGYLKLYMGKFSPIGIWG
jgi:hypothetical protein